MDRSHGIEPDRRLKSGDGQMRTMLLGFADLTVAIRAWLR
jgi:hypothetical protein